MGFADSGTTVSIANPADIATAIGADPSGLGARLISNKDTVYKATNAPLAGLTGGGSQALLSPQLDVSAGVMVTIRITAQATSGATPPANGPSAGNVIGFDLELDWYDALGNLIVSEVFEVVCGIGAPLTWIGTLPARGALLTLTAVNPSGSWINGGTAQVVRVNTSSRPVPPQVVTSQDFPGSGLLLVQSLSVPANSNTILLAGNSAGRQYVDIQAAGTGAAVTLRADLALGLNRLGPILWRNSTSWPTTPTQSSVGVELPATGRPLSLNLVNTSTTNAIGVNVAIIGQNPVT